MVLTSSGDWGSVEAVVGDRVRACGWVGLGGRPGVCTDTRVEWGTARFARSRSELFCRQRQRISPFWRALSALPRLLRQAMAGTLSAAKRWREYATKWGSDSLSACGQCSQIHHGRYHHCPRRPLPLLALCYQALLDQLTHSVFWISDLASIICVSVSLGVICSV